VAIIAAELGPLCKVDRFPLEQVLYARVSVTACANVVRVEEVGLLQARQSRI
jgi:hypothetical protein